MQEILSWLFTRETGTIILGVFGLSFDKLKKQEKALDCYDWSDQEWPKKNKLDLIYSGAEDRSFYYWVGENCYTAKRIVFDVTHLYSPFNSNIVTLNELWIIMNNQILFDKTDFFVNCKKINEDKLKELFVQNEAVTLSELQELFI